MVTARLPSVPDLTLGKPEFFAECPISDTRQTCLLCRVSNPGHSTNLSSLSSVKYWTLGKDWLRTYKCWLLCRVSQRRHSAKKPFYSQNAQKFATCPLCGVFLLWHSAKELFVECNTRQSDHIFSVFIVRSRITYPTQINITGITHSSQ